MQFLGVFVLHFSEEDCVFWVTKASGVLECPTPIKLCIVWSSRGSQFMTTIDGPPGLSMMALVSELYFGMLICSPTNQNSNLIQICCYHQIALHNPKNGNEGETFPAVSEQNLRTTLMLPNDPCKALFDPVCSFVCLVVTMIIPKLRD